MIFYARDLSDADAVLLRQRDTSRAGNQFLSNIRHLCRRQLPPRLHSRIHVRSRSVPATSIIVGLAKSGAPLRWALADLALVAPQRASSAGELLTGNHQLLLLQLAKRLLAHARRFAPDDREQVTGTGDFRMRRI